LVELRGGIKIEPSSDEVVKSKGGKPDSGSLDTLKVEVALPKRTGAWKEQTPAPPTGPSRKRVLLAVSYLAGMGLCGVVLAALGSSLNGLAINCGTTSIEVGSVFVARGAGAVTGTLCSANLYRNFNGKIVMGAALVFFAVALVLAPSVTSVRMLHILFGAFGVCTALLDTGCQIQTRKLHGREAGPWLGANTVAFGISGCVVPYIAYLTGSLQRQYAVLSMLSALVLLMVALAPVPSPEEIPPPAIRPKSSTKANRSYTTEFIIAVMVFCLVGGKVTSTAYFTNYVMDTNIIDDQSVHFLLMLLWGGITAGRFAGIQNQRFFNLSALYRHFNVFLIMGAAGMGLLSLFSKKSFVLWLCVAVYGFFNGPTVGFSYDLNNRLTSPSELGTSIVMLGLNTGASLLPFLTAYAWNRIGYISLPVILTMSHIVPLVLIRIAKKVNHIQFQPTVKED